MLLDSVHEELKPLYTKNRMFTKQETTDGFETTQKQKCNQKNKDKINEKSIIRDIFGGELKTELNVEAAKRCDVQYEPFYTLNIEIGFDC